MGEVRTRKKDAAKKKSSMVDKLQDEVYPDKEKK